MRVDFLQYIIELDIIDSTNDYLKHNYQKLPNFTIVKANYQTNGHGQFGRLWESKYNQNLMFSILIKKELPFLNDDVNPIIVSSIFNALDEFDIDAHYKYPNDIYVGNKKVAGILIETKYDDSNLQYMIIGIGLNVNQEEFDTLNACSMKQILKKEIDMDYVFKRLLKHLSNNVLLVNLMSLGDVSDN